MQSRYGAAPTAAVVLAALVVMLGAGGCSWSGGFLSDYSGLTADRSGPERGPGAALQYFSSRAGDYERFIVEPVEIQFYKNRWGVRTDKAVLRDLANYTYDSVVGALVPEYAIVSRKGPRIARIRVAVTNIDEDAFALRGLSDVALAGVGLGGAALEVEAIDSLTGEQIAAVVLPAKDGQFFLADLTHWGSAKTVVDAWTREFRGRVDRARGVGRRDFDKDKQLARRRKWDRIQSRK